MNDLFIVMKCIFGSHLYGTDTPNSDKDYKGIFLPNKKQIFLGNIPKSIKFDTKVNHNERNTPDDVDVEIFSLHYFIKLACEGQTGPIDMLHCPKNMLIKSSEIWDYIVKNRYRFYTRSLESFVGYARTQAAKYGVKGSRLSDAQDVVNFLSKCNEEARIETVWDFLPMGDHIHKITDSKGVSLYQVCGRSVQHTARIKYALEVFNNFLIKYGERARMAAENVGIDWKAVSHAIRAAIQIKDIFTKGTIEFPLKEADYLKQVKAGQLNYKREVGPKLDNMMSEVEYLSRNSNLPEKADRSFWDNFLMEVIGEYVAK